jgi:uncharacterized protein YkwD
VLLSLVLGRRAASAQAASAGPAALSAAGSVYSLYIPLFAHAGTPGSVNISSRQSSLSFYNAVYNVAPAPAADWTGNHATCNPGTTADDFQDAVLDRINYFRAMAGVPADVSLTADSDRQAQAAALMMSVNGTLSHSPPADWACYSAEGAAGAGSANLYLGTYALDAITGFMRDPGAGNDRVGHRRWLLYPQTRTMGTGNIPPAAGYPASSALRVFDSHMWEPRPPVRDEFVAWPPPGYVPYPVVFARWSFSYPDADFGAATVTMRSGSASVTLKQSAPVDGFGENTLVWIPLGLADGANWPRPTADTAYDVTISNVLINNQSRDFTYRVIVFDPQQ